MPTATFIASSTISANTDIDLSEEMDADFDRRQGVDPVNEAEWLDVSGGSGTSLTSLGQGATNDPSAGEIAVTGARTVAIGDALDSGDVLVVAYETENTQEVPL